MCVSFGSNIINFPVTTNKNGKNSAYGYHDAYSSKSYKNEKEDTFETKDINQRKAGKNHRKKRKIKSNVAAILAAFAIGGCVGNICATKNTEALNYVVVQNYDEINLDELAEFYNSNADIIAICNNLEKNPDEITVPIKYDYLEQTIEKSLAKYSKDAINSEQQEKIEELYLIQEYQNALADTYQDDKYIYFVIKEPDENAPDFIIKNHKTGISAEELKCLFAIEDGAIRKNNDISFSWASYGPESETYKDYSGAYLRTGRIIKVEKSQIHPEDILDTFETYKYFFSE